MALVAVQTPESVSARDTGLSQAQSASAHTHSLAGRINRAVLALTDPGLPIPPSLDGEA
jgi:hypothetical protein